MISNLFKLPRHKTFNYKPQFYDPVKEEIKKKLKEKQGLELSVEEIDVPIKQRMSIKDNYINQKYADRKETRIRIYIRLVTIALLLLIVYMVLDVVVEMY